MKMAVINMQKQGSEEKREEKAHNKVEGGQQIVKMGQRTVRKRTEKTGQQKKKRR